MTGRPLTRADAYENARPDVQALVPRHARRILDVGCAAGALGAALKARQDVEVVGIDADPEYARLARERLDRVVEGDVETVDLDALGRFDCLVVADVLEHLRDPWATLRALAERLEPGATAVVSLPNVRRWDTVWTLLRRGVFPRAEVGTFDRTHLHWFTRADALHMLETAGLRVERVDTHMRLRQWETRWDRRLAWLVGRPGHWLFAFQYVIAARRPG
ncbi:MAG: hypothetical protein QOE65_2690 [Solirubrobacteraceae bacterium]|nr:hypothetical protein [Solirubrobacteraceae bacterium]